MDKNLLIFDSSEAKVLQYTESLVILVSGMIPSIIWEMNGARWEGLCVGCNMLAWFKTYKNEVDAIA